MIGEVLGASSLRDAAEWLPYNGSEFSNGSDGASANASAAATDYLLHEPPPGHALSPAMETLYFVLPGIIGSSVGLLGLVGNIMNIGVLSMAVRQTSRPTYHILLILAVSNNAIMIVYLMFSLTFFVRQRPIVRPEHLPEDASVYQVLLYHTWYFVVNIFVCASHWFVVAVTFFRFLAVRFPMKVGLWCTPRRVKTVAAAVFILSVTIILPDMLTIEASFDAGSGRLRFNDTRLYNDPWFNKTYNTIMHLFVHLLPYCSNVVMVTLLLRTLLRQGPTVLHLTVKLRRSSSREINNRRITVMLVAMVIFSLVTTLPSVCYIVLRDFAGVLRDVNENSEHMLVFRAACDVIELLNYACHFYIYIASNSTYRHKFIRTMSCRETRASLRLESQMSVTSMRRPTKTTLDKLVDDYDGTLVYRAARSRSGVRCSFDAVRVIGGVHSTPLQPPAPALLWQPMARHRTS